MFSQGYTLKGVTPTLMIDTSTIQNTTPTVRSKFNKKTGEMTDRATGVCASLVAFWLSREEQGAPARTADEFPSGFKLSVAQGSYSLSSTSLPLDERREILLDRVGLSVVNSTKRRAKWYTAKTTKVEQAVSQAVKHPGLYFLSIFGDGGHALGVATKHYAQFFDPNFGVFSFKSLSDMRIWIPAAIKEVYPDLMESTGLYGVG